MKSPVVVVSIASIVALSIAAVALAASSGGGSSSESGSGLDSGAAGGGAAGGACPAIDVPNISDEDRERCFGLDSGGSPPTTDDPADSPVSDSDTPVPSDPGDDPKLPPDRVAEPAPIDGLDVRVAESFPPQYFLNVQAGLPSGCAEQYKHAVSRDGDVITVSVLNSMPADPNTACTMIYGTYELNIALGSDFEPGSTYTVAVNDQETTFTAQ